MAFNIARTKRPYTDDGAYLTEKHFRCYISILKPEDKKITKYG